MSTATSTSPSGTVTPIRSGGPDADTTRRAQVNAIDALSTLAATLGPVRIGTVRREYSSRDEFIAAAAVLGAAQISWHATPAGRPKLVATKALGAGVTVELYIYDVALREDDEYQVLTSLEGDLQADLDRARGVTT
ncbi:hypothetical protein [Euzebya rosea]|uniref:hypothetical protein n=1 Tax=Euzebya rosea TaxID=2052804 RepID=UPI0013009886|nr:hypothetical protein [Euzebya rosea]